MMDSEGPAQLERVLDGKKALNERKPAQVERAVALPDNIMHPGSRRVGPVRTGDVGHATQGPIDVNMRPFAKMKPAVGDSVSGATFACNFPDRDFGTSAPPSYRFDLCRNLSKLGRISWRSLSMILRRSR